MYNFRKINLCFLIELIIKMFLMTDDLEYMVSLYVSYRSILWQLHIVPALVFQAL